MSWQRVRGHDGLIGSFADVVNRGRLGHAYLFVGPPGVGKRLFAVELTKALLCESPPAPFDSCDRCPACSQVEAGTHPDVLRAARPEESNDLPIDVIRELSEKLALKPMRGRQKIAIVDNADDFNEPSANAFLKTLEEPPPGSVLILLATDLERQLPTIVSRCQVVRFAPLPPALVAELLRGQGIDSAAADRLARLSSGSLGQAQALADDALWAFRGELVAGLGAAKPDTVALAKKLTAFVEDAGKESAAQRRRATLVLKLLIDFLESALRVSSGATAEDIEPDDRAAVNALANRFGTERLLALIDRCLAAEMHIDRKVQLVLALDALIDAFATAA